MDSKLIDEQAEKLTKSIQGLIDARIALNDFMLNHGESFTHLGRKRLEKDIEPVRNNVKNNIKECLSVINKSF